MESGEPPTVEPKYALVQQGGSRVAREGNSWRTVGALRPVISRSNRCTPSCGAPAMSRWT
jgi:hypothetical protein